MYEDHWVKRDVELCRKHDEIVARRKVLLAGIEAYHDKEANQADYFIGSFTAATERNHQLSKDLHEFGREMKFKARQKEDQRFTTLKNNYWSMVKNVFPVWSEELRDFKHRRRQQESYSPPRSIHSPEVPDDIQLPASMPNTARSSYSLGKSVSIDTNLPKYNKTEENLRRKAAHSYYQ